MSEGSGAAVVDRRDGEALLVTVLLTVQRLAGRTIGRADLDLDLERDLGLRARQRFELAGEIAEIAGLPGAADDEANSWVIETLAGSRTARALVTNAANAANAANVNNAPVSRGRHP